MSVVDKDTGESGVVRSVHDVGGRKEIRTSMGTFEARNHLIGICDDCRRDSSRLLRTKRAGDTAFVCEACKDDEEEEDREDNPDVPGIAERARASASSGRRDRGGVIEIRLDRAEAALWARRDDVGETYRKTLISVGRTMAKFERQPVHLVDSDQGRVLMKLGRT